MPKRTRERQLAKLAARRQAEKAARRHRRNLILGIIASVAALVLIVVIAGLLLGGNGTTGASTSPSSSASSAAKGPCPQTKPPKSSLQQKPTFKNPPPMTIDPSKTYTATFETSCGNFSTKLLAKTAPEAVNNFVFLAKQGFYDGLVFHRIVKGFVIQGGDPKGDGTGGPGYDFPVTVTKGASFDAAGVMAYANSQAAGNQSQFFITLAPQPSLDPPQGKYTIFGNVTKGMDVVTKIGDTPTIVSKTGIPGEQSDPTYPIFILNVTITES